MRGKHHYTIVLYTTYDGEMIDSPSEEKVMFKTNKKAEAERFVERHYYLEIRDSDWVYRRFYIRKDY